MESKYYNALNILFESQFSKLAKLRERYFSWENVWREAGNKFQVDPDAAWRQLEESGTELFLADSEQFPALLKEIPSSPLAVYVRGNKKLLGDGFKIAIVGTRRATASGQIIAKNFARELSFKNIIIVSGLAFGVDKAAHEGCLDAGGQTIAVLAVGLDRCYPIQHQSLADKILEGGGLLVSEYPLASPPLPFRFLERNRVISGLSQGILVVEAPKNSGALATAHYAAEQGREVFAVPGSITSKNYEGSNNLIKEGAALAASPGDITSLFNIAESEIDAKIKDSGLNAAQQSVLSALQALSESASVDKICELAKLDPSSANQALAQLLISGVILEEGGRYYLI